MALFLAQFKLRTSNYMGKSFIGESEFRLVEAACETSAEGALRVALEYNEPYETSVTVLDLEITSTIIAKA